MLQPPIVIECPTCGERYLIASKSNTPSEEATLYSDGYFTDINNWKTPEIIGCITCDLGFLPQNGKIIAEPDWTEFNEKWAHLKKAEPPAPGSLVLELRARKNMDPISELAIRLELWYTTRHTEKGQILLNKNEKFRKFWNESLLHLEELLIPENEKSLLLKAEINRQLGHFAVCSKLLENITNPLATQITTYAQNGISDIFEVQKK